MSFLRIDSISKSFGGVVAVDGFSMEQKTNEIVSIIGPNGAGKTTIFNLITAVYEVDSGSIHFLDQDITDLPGHRRAQYGISRTFQNIRLFNSLSVMDNLKVAYDQKLKYFVWEESLHLPRVAREEKRSSELARSHLAELGLEQYEHYKPGNLAYGLQRRVELARALITNPKLLLLDEPAAGLNPRETRELIDVINKIHEQWEIGIILVEHHMEVVMNISHTIHVLDFGKKIAEGTPNEIKQNPDVLKAYLGDEV